MNNEKFEKVKNYLEDLEDDEILEIWNEYCRETNNELEIFSMGCFSEMFDNTDIVSVAEKICYGTFHIQDTYFVFNGNGNLDSFESFELYNYIYYYELTDYIIMKKEHFNDEKLKKILEEK